MTSLVRAHFVVGLFHIIADEMEPDESHILPDSSFHCYANLQNCFAHLDPGFIFGRFITLEGTNSVFFRVINTIFSSFSLLASVRKSSKRLPEKNNGFAHFAAVLRLIRL